MKAKVNLEAKQIKNLESSFTKHFGNSKGIKYFSSPSSIILLGDHTQYNDGIMVSTVVDSFVYLALRKTESSISIIFEKEVVTGSMESGITTSSENSQLTSLIHLINNLVKDELLGCGFECYFLNKTSKVFGLGNHAAISMGLLNALSSVGCGELKTQQMVEIAVKSEIELFGPVVSKPLFYSSLMQKENTLLYYDNRSDYKKQLPVDENIQIVICNTNHEKENFHDRCHDRIMECEVGVKGLRLYIWGIKNLRDIEEKFLERHIHMLPKRLYSRCLYNVIARKIVEEAHKNLKDKEYELFAQKLSTAHEKLSEIYEISSTIMDSLVQNAIDSNICLGSKMVSCSYHDSTLNFVYKKNVDKFKNHIRKTYSQTNGAELEIETYSIVDAAKQIKMKAQKVTG